MNRHPRGERRSAFEANRINENDAPTHSATYCFPPARPCLPAYRLVIIVGAKSRCYATRPVYSSGKIPAACNCWFSLLKCFPGVRAQPARDSESESGSEFYHDTSEIIGTKYIDHKEKEGVERRRGRLLRRAFTTRNRRRDVTASVAHNRIINNA